MRLYKGHVSDSQFTSDGIGHWIQFGEAIDVNGRPSVDLKHAIVPADGWRPYRADALREVAFRIEELGRRLLKQADEIRNAAEVEVVYDVA